MIGAALLASLAAGTVSAQDVLIYYNSGEMGTSGLAGLESALTSAGASVTTTGVAGTTSWPTSYGSSIKLLIFLLPPDSFSGAEANAVASVVKYGGRVVVTGDWHSGGTGYNAENTYANTLLSNLGVSMRIQNDAIWGGGCSSTTAISSDQLTSGVSRMYGSSSSYVTGGTSLMSNGGKDIIQVEEIPGASGSRTPYDVIVSGDTNAFLDTCTGVSSSTANYGFWTNLYTGLCTDDDGDGYTDSSCGGTDCDDSDASSYPGATETCDGADNDCDSSIDEGVTTLYYRDADSDFYGDASSSSAACSVPAGYVSNSTDCDDTDSSVHPGGTETCDGEDEDCDGDIDEGVENTYYRDSDGDGFGNASVSTDACSVPSGYSADNTDCDDGDGTRYPGAPEVCDGDDEDCDSDIDEGKTGVYYYDADSDGWGDSSITSESCSAGSGYVSDGGDCDDSDSSAYPGATEVPYDGVDQDCDGDDLCDVDGDGVDATDCSPGTDCDDEDPATYPGATERPYDGVDQDCDGADIIDQDGDGYDADHAGGNDCDDTNASVKPGASETCDGIDEDCDSSVDEGTECYDDDGDGSSEDDGDCNDGDPDVGPDQVEIDENGVDDDCDGQVDADVPDPDGDGYLVEGGDCGEGDPNTYPGAPELSDAVDNDCDGEVDEGTASFDDDGDTYTEMDGDCHDGDDTVYPEAPELEDGVDNDCDGVIDEGSDRADDDGDGFTEEAGDCDDGDPGVHPGAEEVADAVDNDCDEKVDEGTSAYDDDTDGFSEDEGDCDDADGWKHPDAPEACDGLDNNCDEIVDEGCEGSESGEPGGSSDTGNCAARSGSGGGWLWLLPLAMLGRRRERRP